MEENDYTDEPLCDDDWFDVGCGMKWRFLPKEEITAREVIEINNRLWQAFIKSLEGGTL